MWLSHLFDRPFFLPLKMPHTLVMERRISHGYGTRLRDAPLSYLRNFGWAKRLFRPENLPRCWQGCLAETTGGAFVQRSFCVWKVHTPGRDAACRARAQPRTSTGVHDSLGRDSVLRPLFLDRPVYSVWAITAGPAVIGTHGITTVPCIQPHATTTSSLAEWE